METGGCHGSPIILPIGVYKELEELTPQAMRIYILLLANYEIHKDEDIDGEWVHGTLQADKREIYGGQTFHWDLLTDAGLIIEEGNNTIGLPKYRKKTDSRVFVNAESKAERIIGISIK